uniref:Uncharacterized protein n=1 Tax=Anguilla anguilla TaxID=7936 RepID=A0A0E9TBA9_ANGAN
MVILNIMHAYTHSPSPRGVQV